MSVKFSDHPIHLQDGIKLDREYAKSQSREVRNADRKVFQRDTLEISQKSKDREAFMYRISHTVDHSVVLFGNELAETLKEVREGTGQYGYSEVVNACGLTYAKLYSDIEQRYENEQEQWYDQLGTPLTKEEEIEWLNMQYEFQVGWYKACARVALQGQICRGHISDLATKEISGVIEELEDSFYQAKDAYMKQHRENKKSGNILTLQNYIFGNSGMYEILNRLGNLRWNNG